METGSSASQSFGILLSGVDDPALRRLFQLCAWGEWGPWAQAWVREFRELGVLHLLVLSGSQVSYLRSSLERLFGAVLRRVGGGGWEAGHLLRIGVGGTLVAYGFEAGWSPPLARAVFLALWDMAWPRGRTFYKCSLTLVSQGLVFPETCGSLSFLLSWTCFLWLQLSRWMPTRWGQGLFVALLCPAWAAWILADPPSGVSGALRLVAANAVLGMVFERFVMPLTGLLLALSFVFCALPDFLESGVLRGVASLTGPPLAGSGAAVLVALGGFRYIWKL